MSKKRLLASASKLSLPVGFADLLGDVKLRIQTAQTRAMTRVNTELVRLYWDIGGLIEQRQQQEGWGASVIPRLSAELRNELPELKGFSERNIGLMCSFYRAYSESQPILQQPVANLADARNSPQAAVKMAGNKKSHQLLHNCQATHKCRNPYSGKSRGAITLFSLRKSKTSRLVCGTCSRQSSTAGAETCSQ